MLVNNVISSNYDIIQLIVDECSQFIDESQQQLLFRLLPSGYPDIKRVRVRKKKTSDVNDVFNTAFDHHHPTLRQRAMMAYPAVVNTNESENDLFIVFPIDGYKFMYSTNIINSQDQYNHLLDVVGETDSKLLADTLQFTYTTTDLADGIKHGCEIVIYNIPYYYAIRWSTDVADALVAANIAHTIYKQ